MMQEKILPTQYHLEVYEDSFANDPSFHMQSLTPFSGISIGVFFNHRAYDCWSDRPKTATEKFVVKQVEHIFWVVEGSHNSQKIMLVLKKEPYSW